MKKQTVSISMACLMAVFLFLISSFPVHAVSDETADNAQRLGEGDRSVWQLDILQEGEYDLVLRYKALPDTGDSIRIIVSVDGESLLPEGVTFYLERLWMNEDDTKTDIFGNQIRPAQTEYFQWQTKRLSAAVLSGEKVYRYFTAGRHTVTVEDKQEQFLLADITAVPVRELPTYAEKLAEYREKGFQNAKTEPITLEAESGAIKSSQSLYPVADRSSPLVSPSDAGRIYYNAIGGTQWKTEGQWIEWQVEIPADGLYTLGFCYKQDGKSDAVSMRELTIDGEVPFQEAAALCFPYSGSWSGLTVGDSKNKPYRFYLEKGTHTLRLCAVTGAYGEIITKADTLITELNRIYRKIVVVTGVTPDVYRTYEFEKVIPDVLRDMENVSKELKALEKTIRSAGFSGNQGTDIVKRVYYQIDKMTEDSDSIARRLPEYRDQISSMGTWRNQLAEQPLTLDRIFLSGEENQTPVKTSVWSAIVYQMKQFLYSYVNDYSQIGKTEENISDSTEVWMSTGRDQAQILKSLISQRFTPETGIAVDLQLVAADSLLPALLAGTGPDVSIGLAQTEPLNLALRNAVYDLTSFSDYSAVAERFYPESIVPFTFGGVWALPDTLSYQMLFYRKDIMEELSVSTNSLSTVDGLIKNVLPVVQKNGLNIGVAANLNTYLWVLYQMNGALYTEDGKTSRLSDSQAIRAMSLYETFYSQYQLPIAFDAANRFRSGEMPIMLADYLFYNQLTVFAPEIAGVWGMMPVPGTQSENGKITAISPVTVTGTAVMQNARKPEAAWEFVKWWLSADIQADYGRDLESIVGAAARYNTANIEAMNTVKWDADMKQALLLQRTQLKGMPQVPGGYLTEREFNFAFRAIVYEHKKVRLAMNEAADHINKELMRKCAEYGIN